MAKQAKGKADKKEKQPTTLPSAAMRRKKEEEAVERERLQQEKANKKKKNVLPPPPAMMDTDANAVNGEEIGGLAGESVGKAEVGMQGMAVDGDEDIKMTDAKQGDGQSYARPEMILLDVLIKRFEESFNKEKSLFPPGGTVLEQKKPVLSAFLKEREMIGKQMASVYGKLGVETRDVFRL